MRSVRIGFLVNAKCQNCSNFPVLFRATPGSFLEPPWVKGPLHALIWGGGGPKSISGYGDSTDVAPDCASAQVSPRHPFASHWQIQGWHQGPCLPCPLDFSEIFFKIMQFSGNVKQTKMLFEQILSSGVKTPVGSKLHWGPPDQHPGSALVSLFV